MKKKYQTNIILSFLITILTLYIINSKLITSSILEYTNLFITKLFPTSFLLFTFSSLLINFNFIENLSKITKKNSSVFYITIMSLISGFPSGTKYTSDLYNKKYISKETANNILTYTHFPNPLFILGPVSNLIQSQILSIKLLLSIILANTITAIIFHKKDQSSIILNNTPLTFSKALNNSILSALKTQILIYGTSLFFYLISCLITTYLILPPFFYIITNGIFDLTKGIFSAALLQNNITSSYLILTFISFGSLSIHIQIKSILTDTSLSYKYFCIGRIISTIISIIIFSLLISF